MDALTAWRGKGLLAACICVILTAWTAAPARAESLTVRMTDETAANGPSLPAGSPAAEFAPAGETPTRVKDAGAPAAVGNLFALLVAGTVLFGDSPSDFTPDNPPATDLTTNTDGTVNKDGSTDKGGPTDKDKKDGVIPQGNPTPEPASLLIGLIGSACAGAAVWTRRRKKGETT